MSSSVGEAVAARVLLLEVVNADQFPGRISAPMPFIRGYLDRVGAEALWLRFGLPTHNKLAHGTDDVTFSEEDFATVLRAVDELRPTLIIATDRLCEPQRAALAERVADFALHKDFEGLPGRPRYSGQDHLLDEAFSPRYDWEPGNEAALQPESDNIYLTLAQSCGHRAPVAVNARYAGLCEEAIDGHRGCAFCHNWQRRHEWEEPPAGLQEGLAQRVDPRGADRSLLWVRRQLEAIARSRAACGRWPFAVLIESLPRHEVFTACLEILEQTGLAARVRLLLAARADQACRVAEAFAAHLRENPGSPQRFGVYACGVESFVAEELALFNKGTRPLDGLRAIRCLRELAQRLPERFSYTGISFVLLSPWTRPEDLHLNVGLLRALGLTCEDGNLFQSRLRLHEGLPITALAAREGLLIDHESDEYLVLNRRKLFDEERPWRFADERLQPLARLLARFEFLDSPLGDALARAVAERLQKKDGEAWLDEDLFDLLLAALDTLRARTEVLTAEALLDLAATLLKRRRSAPPSLRPYRVGEERVALAPLVERLAPVIVSGARPVLSVAGLLPSDFDEGLREAVAACGLVAALVPHPGALAGTGFLLLARAQEALAAVVEALAAGDLARAAIARGLPPCCAHAAAARPDGGLGVDPWAAWALRAASPGSIPAANHPLLAPSAGFLPCTADCEAAAQVHAEIFAALGLSPEGADLVSLEGEGEGELVRLALRESGEFDPAGVNGPDDELRRALRAGARLRQRPGQILVQGDEEAWFTATHVLWQAERCEHAAEWAEIAHGAQWRRRRALAVSAPSLAPGAFYTNAARVIERVASALTTRTGFTLEGLDELGPQELRVRLSGPTGPLHFRLSPRQAGAHSFLAGERLALSHEEATPVVGAAATEAARLLLRALERLG